LSVLSVSGVAPGLKVAVVSNWVVPDSARGIKEKASTVLIELDYFIVKERMGSE
jgi:hypothetical protein